MKKIILLFSISIFLFSCEKEQQAVEQTSNAAVNVDLLFEKDGCKVYRFYDNGYAIYFTDCRGRVEYKYTTSTGKSSQTHHIQNETVE